MLCCAVLCCAVLCYAMLCYAVLCYAMLCYAMLCCAMLCYAVLCCAMLMLCYAMLCYCTRRPFKRRSTRADPPRPAVSGAAPCLGAWEVALAQPLEGVRTTRFSTLLSNVPPIPCVFTHCVHTVV